MSSTVRSLLPVIATLLMSIPIGHSLAHINVGDKLPLFQCEQTDGRIFHYPTDVKSNSTIILFWATWSERSLVELNDLCSVVDSAHLTFTVIILAINVDTQAFDQNKRKQMIQPFERYQTKPVFCWDKMGELSSRFGIIATPSLILVDSISEVKYTAGGYSLKLRDWIKNGFTLHTTRNESAISQNWSLVLRYYHTGEQLLRKRKPTSAESYFRKALEFDSTYTLARCQLARAQLQYSDTTKAINTLWKAVALDRTSDVAYSELSRVYHAKNEENQAVCLLDTALMLNKKCYPAQLLWLEMRILQHDALSADSLIRELKESCSNDPSFVTLLTAKSLLVTDSLEAYRILRTGIVPDLDNLEGSRNEARH